MKFKKSLTTKNILNPEKSIAMKQEETMKGQTTNCIHIIRTLSLRSSRLPEIIFIIIRKKGQLISNRFTQDTKQNLFR